ncbi:MAG: class I SAM-dependent methyltransferase [Candidatus Dadabacteria bacterium]|nr:class I SAM-dependent methyltransferase [Candidatus Dadabacteria bacterium]
MASYDAIGKFYDDIMGDQKESAKQIYKLIKKFHPAAQSVLELGCGTGSYLQHLSRHYNTAGLDQSSVMLSIAREKLPKAELYQTGMLEFKFNKRFDVIICMNDTFNHFIKVLDIKKLLLKVYEHLAENGIFIFDINTEHKLNTLSESPPIIHQFGDNYFITNVSVIRNNIYEWDLRIFENIENNNYRLYEELLYERSYTIFQIEKFLTKIFRNVNVFDLNKKRVSSTSERLHFVCIKN